MSAWFNKYGPQLADSIHSTKQTILAMLYVSYLYNATRNEYIESRKHEYLKHYSKSRAVKSANMFADESCKSLSDEHTADILLELDKTIRNFSPLEEPPLCSDSIEAELDKLLEKEFECPLPELPKSLKFYRYFSTTFISVVVVKNTCLCIIYYSGLNIDRKYGCYLPGRVAFVPDAGLAKELPWIAFLIFLYHLIWRAMWYFVDRLELDSLLFLCYDRETVLNKQYQVIELNDPNITPPDVAYRKYLCNRIFYRRYTDYRGQVVYTMRHHRTVGHYDALQNLMVKLRLYMIYTFYMNMVLLIIGATYTQLRHDYFDMSYPSCRQFVNAEGSDDFEWSFSSKFRLWYLFADLLESTIFFFDSMLLMALAVAAGIVLSHDLYLRFKELRMRTCKLNEKFKFSTSNNSMSAAIRTSMISHSAMKFIEHLHKESYWIFEKTISTFEDISRVDEYVRKLSTYIIFTWLGTCSSYQATSILSLVPKGGLVTYFNTLCMVAVSILISVAFLFLARPYHQARLFYNELCTAMAMSPTIPRSKIAWRWLLEYYKDTSVYSLHLLGKSSFPISNLNILRCISWFVTCSVVLLSLLRH